MHRMRRRFLNVGGSMSVLALSSFFGLFESRQGWAADWNKAGFESKA
ncbi:MAG: hypothetical protein V7640_3862, partial [Betaproteobacteria bacterium]